MDDPLGDIEVKKNQTPTLQEKFVQKWELIFGIIVACVVITVGITFAILLAKGQSNELSKSVSLKTLKIRLPYAEFEKCCSTNNDKIQFLMECNEVFQKEDIRCVSATKGSIITHLEGHVHDISKSASKALFGVTHIGEYPAHGFHIYDEGKPTNDTNSTNDTNPEDDTNPTTKKMKIQKMTKIQQ
jgi:hypothetical protein